MIIVNHHKNKNKSKSHHLISKYKTTNNQSHLKINSLLKEIIQNYIVNKLTTINKLLINKINTNRYLQIKK